MITDYYYDFSSEMKKNFSGLIFDEDGIPMIKCQKKIGILYNPVTIAQYSLANMSLYLKNKTDDKKFMNGAEWLVKNVSGYKNNSSVWFYRFDINECGLKAPWISAMAQGLAISLLVRAYEHTNNNTFLKIAEKAVNVFELPVEKGGVLASFPDGDMVFEEYPTVNRNSVLNGFLFSILGLYDLIVFTENEKAKSLFEKAIISLKNNINNYDTGYWTLYDLRSDRRLASFNYHKLHIELLDILYNITREKFFIQLRNIWNRYYRSYLCGIRFILNKVFEKMFKVISLRT